MIDKTEWLGSSRTYVWNFICQVQFEINPWLCSIILKEALRNHNKIGSKIYYCVLFLIWPPSSTGEKK